MSNKPKGTKITCKLIKAAFIGPDGREHVLSHREPGEFTFKSMPQLREILTECELSEDYEKCARIRDEINKRVDIIER